MNAISGEVSIDNGPPVPGKLTIEVEQVDVTMSKKISPDLRWEYTDAVGHFHAYAQDGTLPTLDSRSEHVDCDGHAGEFFSDEGCDGYDITVRFCAICGETVEPGVVVTYPVGPEYVEGRTHWQVEVAQRLERGQRVSVKVTLRDQVFFGIGEAGAMSAEGGHDGIRFSTAVLAAGPLGQRRSRVKASV